MTAEGYALSPSSCAIDILNSKSKYIFSYMFLKSFERAFDEDEVGHAVHAV